MQLDLFKTSPISRGKAYFYEGADHDAITS